MLEVSDKLDKIKGKMLLVSGIALFISLTKTLPVEVKALGLNLKGNEPVFGWFVLAIASYFFIRFLMFSIVELVHYYLPDIISIKASKTTGDVLGFKLEDCHEYQDNNRDYYEDFGTKKGEIYQINKKNEKIQRTYNKRFIVASNIVSWLFELLGPAMFSGISIYYLYCFLIQANLT